MKRLAFFLPFFLALAGAAPSVSAAPDVEEIAEGDFLLDPPGVDAPAVRTPRLRSLIYTDFTFVSSPKLRGIPLVQGNAQNYRFALGGAVKLDDLEVNLEIPFAQVTKAHFDQNAFTNRPQDQSTFSFGDIRLGATYRKILPFYPPKMLVGGALRARFPTHTTSFDFDVSTGERVEYPFPRYFHIEPAVLFATALGPLSLLADQGILFMPGKDIEVNGFPQEVPHLYFWTSHLVAGLAFVDTFGVTLELNTVVELGDPANQPDLRDITAVWLLPGVQVYLGAFKLDLAARIGLTDGTDALGVITFAGRHAALLRLTRSLDFDASSLFGR